MSGIVNEELGVMYSIREEDEEEETTEEEKQELSRAISDHHGSAEKQQPTIVDDDYNVGSSNYITFNIFTQEGKEMMWYRTMSEASKEDVPRSSEEGVKSWKKKVEGVIGRMTKSWSEQHPDGGITVDSPRNRKKGNGVKLMGGCLYGIGENKCQRRKRA